MFAQKTYNYAKLHAYQIISTKHRILHSLRLFTVWVCLTSFLNKLQLLYNLWNSQTACAGLYLLIKRRADVVLVCFHVSLLCCFGYFQKSIKWTLVSKICVTPDVISSNLILILFSTRRSYTSAILVIVILSVCPSVRLSVCPSVRPSGTRVLYDETVFAIMILSPLPVAS